MNIKTAKYIISSPSIALCPVTDMLEFAFIGRSNVGKSSLINYLTNNGSLAKVSNNPGKTRYINHFLINNEFHLVDLPGYGYAKVSKTDREKWGAFIEDYILNRENLKILFVLVDSSIPPQKTDLEFLAWLDMKQINFTVITTKNDKKKPKEILANLAEFKKQVEALNIKEINIIPASSLKKLGQKEILDLIEQKIQQNLDS